ncbi:MAG: V-type ATP synthase subunit E [bacterium]
MEDATSIEALKAAMFERAERLADEYHQRALQTRERIISDENERLRISEERETLSAEVDAEQAYRQQVQVVELRCQGELEQFRWELVGEVKQLVRLRFEQLTESRDYLPVLGRLLRQAATSLSNEQGLVAQLNQQDHEKLSSRWEAFVEDVVGESSIALNPDPGSFLGGVIVSNEENTVCVDNTLEGRMSRLSDALSHAIMTELFLDEDRSNRVMHGG